MNLPAGVTNRIVLVRHGEPEAAARGRCYGKLDVSLSEIGKTQMAETARWLRQRFALDAVYASPRVRALESARIIARQFNLCVEPTADFAEIDFGDFEGLEYAEVERRFPDLYRQWMNAPTKVKFPNGESFGEMQRRVLAAAAKLAARHAGETFAVVSHGGVNRILLAAALNINDTDIFRLGQDYAAANVIDFFGEFPVVRAINAASPIS